ncbi:MAG: hypothetical protein HOO06_13435 [Bdellovibrionaceae bacterium]|nr:hypothetical protein [Pseudobdellovibrionaceae bacterium]
MKSIFKFLYLLPLLTLLSSPTLFAKTSDGDLNYPELMVTPRASERLAIEAKKEANMDGYWYKQHMTLQLSALATLVSGVQSSGYTPEDNTQTQEQLDSIKFAQIVGVGWLAITTYMVSEYRPYKKSYAEIKKLPRRYKKEKLTRERISEEHLRKTSTIGKRLAWSSFVTNFLASAAVASSSGGNASIFAGISTLVSLGPIFIDYNWEEVYDSHLEYKKKIYGPVAHTGILKNSDNKYIPALYLSYNF